MGKLEEIVEGFWAPQYSRCSFSMMVKWPNDGLFHQAIDGRMHVNDGETLVNDGEMLVNDGETLVNDGETLVNDGHTSTRHWA